MECSIADLYSAIKEFLLKWILEQEIDFYFSLSDVFTVVKAVSNRPSLSKLG